MKLNYSIQAAVAAAALTLSVSGAQAQYVTVPPVASGSATVLPYGGYYGPAITTGPSVSFGAPYFSPLMGGYGFGDLSYGNYNANGYGYGYMGNYGTGNFGLDQFGYGANPYSGGSYGGYSPFGTAQINDVNGGKQGDQTVNPTEVQGGVVDPNNPNAGANWNTGAVPDAPSASAAAAPTQRRAVSPVVVRKAPYHRVAISYLGDTSNVSRITMMLLDRRGREVQQDVLTSAPASTQLRVSAGARYYRVIVNYSNGTTRTYTHALNVK